MNLFPSIQPEVVSAGQELPLYREVSWDYEKNVPRYKNGNPAYVSGKDAVAVWAWKALHTPRFRYAIYSWNYGNEAESLIGQNYSAELKQSEAARYVRECLMTNPYIKDVTGVTINFADGLLTISGTIITLYGEAILDVREYNTGKY